MKILEVLTRARTIGNKGERIAVRELRKKGYKIIAKNYVAGGDEIDIIAENKEVIAFVEVKTRTVGKSDLILPRPASAVNAEKQRKIIKTANFFLGGYKKKRRVSLDVFEVYLTPEGKREQTLHIENAFNKNTAYERR